MKNAIFITFDDRFSSLARACLKSLVQNYPEHPQLFVYYDGKSERILKFLQGIPNTQLVPKIEIPGISDSLNLGEVGSATVYYRYFAWGDFFADFDNVLYLDVDTLILRSLDDLLDTSEFFVVENREPTQSVRVFDPNDLQDEGLCSLLAQDQLPTMQGEADMCNAGVFVIPRKLRSLQSQQQLVEITNRYNRYLKFADQSAISLWCRKNNIQFSTKYEFNYQITFFNSQLDRRLRDIYVLHFSSVRKPGTRKFLKWKRIALSLRIGLSLLFLKYLII